jgi:hypothetical protein
VTVGEDGKQIRVFRSDWSKEEGENALAERTLKSETPKSKNAGITFAQAVERYLVVKVRKRTLTEDERILGHLKEHFGKDTALAEITASRISEYKGHRLAAVTGATVNRALGCYGISYGWRTKSGRCSTQCPGSGWRRRARAACGG